jgi:hypothetical protein
MQALKNLCIKHKVQFFDLSVQSYAYYSHTHCTSQKRPVWKQDMAVIAEVKNTDCLSNDQSNYSGYIIHVFTHH